MGRSILDDLGEEVTGIVAPVSICMALTVALVRLLNPEGKSDTGAVYLATSFYVEEEGDTTGQKLSGSLINALVFVTVVAVMTFVLVLLFKYGYTKIIYAYMGFAGFSIFFVLTGIIAIKLLQKANIHMDIISFCYILFNFAVVGALTLFFLPAPLLMKQGYLVVTGVAVAYVFTWIPEWTTWILLVAMALYDILAVLVPGGPLKMLVEMAQEREEQIPALVYEARPTRREGSHADRLTQLEAEQQRRQQQEGEGSGRGSERGGELWRRYQDHFGAHVERRQELQEAGAASARVAATEAEEASHERLPQLERTSSHDSDNGRVEAPDVPLLRPAGASSHHHHKERPQSAPTSRGLSRDNEGAAAVQPSAVSAPSAVAEPLRVGAGLHLRPEVAAELEAHPDEASIFGLPESIKLGLGDFIFYSVLVGRAAMYDMLTVFACYLAIIAGLGCTLLLLAMAHKALPALPMSITLAVVFYFVSRFVMEPVVLPMTLQLIFF